MVLLILKAFPIRYCKYLLFLSFQLCHILSFCHFQIRPKSGIVMLDMFFRLADWSVRPHNSLIDDMMRMRMSLLLLCLFFFCVFFNKTWRPVIVWLSSCYCPVIVRLSCGYRPVIVQSSSCYRPVIVRLSSSYCLLNLRLCASPSNSIKLFEAGL